MTAALTILAQHAALIRDYAASSPAPAPPASPPVPSPAPPPPDTTPPVFTVAAVSPVDFTISTAISPARTLATITTAETSVAILASASVPGVTFNVVGSPVTSITATGTPTTAAQTRVVLTYVRNDGSGLVLGSSTHVINVIDPSILFVAGANASYSGRAGVPVAVTLCSPSLALDVDVLAFPNVGTPGCTVSLAWTRGGTSTGVLTLAGTPTTEGVYSLTVTYYALGRIVGTSAHTITITAAWTPAPSPPAPAPAPTPPTPAPVPSPPAAPTPGPLPAADPPFASVLMLHHFDAADVAEEVQAHRGDGPVTGGGEVLTITRRNFASAMGAEEGQRIVEVTEIRPRPYRGNSILPGQFTRALNVCTMIGGPIADLVGTADAYFTYREPLRYVGTVGPSLAGRMLTAAGAAGEAAGFDGGAGIEAAIDSTFDATLDKITAEFMVRVDAATGLWGAGTETLFTPLLTCLNPGGEFVWCMGLTSVYAATGRQVTPKLWRATRHAASGNPTISVSGSGVLTAAPGRFIHFAAQFGPAGERNAAWWDGVGGQTTSTLDSPAIGVALRSGAVLRLGGSVTLPSNAGPAGARLRPLSGAVDELRIAAADRYSYADATTTSAISAALRGIPWPNY